MCSQFWNASQTWPVLSLHTSILCQWKVQQYPSVLPNCQWYFRCDITEIDSQTKTFVFVRVGHVGYTTAHPLGALWAGSHRSVMPNGLTASCAHLRMMRIDGCAVVNKHGDLLANAKVFVFVCISPCLQRIYDWQFDNKDGYCWTFHYISAGRSITKI